MKCVRAAILMLLPLAAALLIAQTSQPVTPAVIKPNDNLVLDGIPPVPVSLAQGTGHYTDFRSAAFAAWNPAQRQMLIHTRFADTSQIHLVKFPGGDRKQLTFFPDNVGGATWCPAHPDSFIFSKDNAGDEFNQLYRFDISTGDITLLTDGKSKNSFPIWSPKGDRLAYMSLRRNGHNNDFYIQNPLDPKSDRMIKATEESAWYLCDWSPDETQLLAAEMISVNESYLYLLDIATGKMTLLTPKNAGKIAWNGGLFSKDGKGIFTATDKGSEFIELAYMDLATQTPTILTADIPWDVESFDLCTDGSKLAFITNEDGLGKLHILDTRTRKQMPMPPLPAGQTGGLAWNHAGNELAFNLSSAKSPPDVYSIDVATGKIERWTESETAGLNTSGFTEPDTIHWKTFDQKTISGFLYHPPTRFTGKRPVLIDIHGGPEGQFRPGFLGRFNYFTNELGLALILPNVRGSTGYGKTFTMLDNGMLREDAVKDIGSLLDWIKTQPDLDPDRIMVSGASYGGYMSLAVATHYADRIRCSLDVVGISNFVSFLENTEEYRVDLRRVEYGDETIPEVRDFLMAISPLTNADKIKKPLFVVAGKNDPRVVYTEGERIVAAVKKTSTPVWYLLAKDEGHGFAKKSSADFQFYATILFMREYLLK